MILKKIKYQSEEYAQMLLLRTEILRKPLGLTFTEQQLSLDKDDILIGCFDEEENDLMGCCILSKIDGNTIQLRQMAVSKKFQGEGIGKLVVGYAEEVSKAEGYCKIVLHARKSVKGFYEKLGYSIIGKEFIEVSIPHFEMEKTIL